MPTDPRWVNIVEKNIEEIWANCLSVIKDNVSLQSFKTWFEPIKPLKLKNSVLTIQVPSQFFYEWLEEHYIELLRKTIRKEISSDAKLEYSIIMENNYKNTSPYTVKIPTSNKSSLKKNIGFFEILKMKYFRAYLLFRIFIMIISFCEE